MTNSKTVMLLREREIRGDVKKNREKFMLEKAREMLNSDGFQALTLPGLAEFSGYSKPTIYKYFPNKEDLMVALAVESTALQISYLESAAQFKGKSREKIHVIHSLDTTVLQEFGRDFLLIHTNKIRSMASLNRQKQLDDLVERRLEILAGIIHEAVQAEDLNLPAAMTKYELIFILMATVLGGHAMRESDSPVMEKWFKEINFQHSLLGILLDGLGWKPFSDEWDYSESINRFYNEVFPELATKKKEC